MLVVRVRNKQFCFDVSDNIIIARSLGSFAYK